MNKRGHLSSVALVLALVLVTSPATLASQLEIRAAEGPRAAFSDIEDNWARDYIEQMAAAGVVKGINENEFAPTESVENIQILVMLVRALGLEERALAAAESVDTSKKMAGIPAWARGHALVACEEGLITESEIEQLHPAQKASRLDLAGYLSPLMGEVEDYWQDDYDLLMSADLGDLDTDLKAKAVLMAKKGIMVGTPEGKWLPHSLVSRDQMAKILALILNPLAQQRGLPSPQAYGRLTELSLPQDSKKATIVIEDGKGSYLYQLAGDCAVSVDGLPSPLAALEPQQRVWLTMAEIEGSQEVVHVKAKTPRAPELKVEGTVSGLTLGKGAAVEVTAATGRQLSFQVDDRTYITVDGKQAFVSDLRLGQKIELEAEQRPKTDLALDIRANTKAREVEGMITVVVIKNSPSLSLTATDGEAQTFRITEQTKVWLNGKPAVLEDLRPGDAVQVQGRDEAAVVVRAQRQEPEEKELVGTIVALVFKEEPSLILEIAPGLEHTYRATTATKIRVDGEEAALDALEVGWQVRLKVKGDEILLILGGFSFYEGE